MPTTQTTTNPTDSVIDNTVSRPAMGYHLHFVDGMDWTRVAETVGYNNAVAARNSVRAWQARNHMTDVGGLSGRPARAWLDTRTTHLSWHGLAARHGYANAQAARSSVDAWRHRRNRLYTSNTDLEARVRRAIAVANAGLAAQAQAATGTPLPTPAGTAPAMLANRTGYVVSDRKFGVEIECITPGMSVGTIAARLQAEGIDAEAEGYRWTHVATETTWKVTTDSSCGTEVVSPILRGEAGAEMVARVMEVLRRPVADGGCGARVNRNCGMHVHVDVTDLTADGLADLYATYTQSQDAINGLVARSRRDTFATYLNTATVDERDRVIAALRAGRLRTPGADTRHDPSLWTTSGPYISRYRKLNITSFVKYGTYEFRQHQGTLNGTKARGWIGFVTGLTEAAADGALTGGLTFTEGTNLLTALRATGFLATKAQRNLARRVAA